MTELGQFSLRPGDIRIAPNGDVWIQDESPEFGPYEWNKTRLDIAMEPGPIKFPEPDLKQVTYRAELFSPPELPKRWTYYF